MENIPLHDRLMEDARRYNPAEHTRSLLAPYRDVVLLWRVKFMSYEQIAATLTRHGLKVSPAAVGVFCRRAFTKAEIIRERQRLNTVAGQRLADSTTKPTPGPVPATPGKRGPKIARDDY